MRHKDLSVTIALCASLVAHAVLAIALAEQQVHELSQSLHQPPIDLKSFLARHPQATELPDVQAIPLPELAALPAPKLPEVPVYEELFGEHGGKGKGLKSAPGEAPMQARLADQEQASLTPHPGPAGEKDPGSSGN